jgi:predicted transcriptional regulator YdeE
MKKKMLLTLLLLTSSLFADEALDKQFREINCNTRMDIVKELVEKGANINQLNENGDTLFTVCASQGNKYNNDMARYLSSVGAKDTGYTYYPMAYGRYKYDTPKVFENKHLKMTVLEVTARGYSIITFENKMPDPIYIKSQTTDVNGYKWFFDEGNYTINPYSKYDDRRIRGANQEKGYKERMPKVVNNKVNLTRQATFKYTYKGKEYELKTPVIKDEIDVVYMVNPFGG